MIGVLPTTPWLLRKSIYLHLNYVSSLESGTYDADSSR